MQLLKNNHGCLALLLVLCFLAMAQASNNDSSREVRRLVGVLRRESNRGYSGRRLHSKKEGPPPTQEPPLPVSSEGTELWNVVDDANGNVITTCKDLPEGNSTSNMFAKVISFDYYLYSSETGNASVASQIATVEAESHEALTPMVLPCSFVEGDTIVAALSSEGADTLIGECQGDTISPCWQVRAQMTMVMSSTLSDPEWLELLYPYIEESLATAVDGQNIVNIEFQGFVDSDLNDGQTLPATDATNPSGNSASAMQGNMALSAPPSQGLGPSAIAIAVVVLVLVSAFLIHRNRRRQALFVAQLEPESCDDDNPPPAEEKKHKVAFMNDHECLGQGDAEGLEVTDDESIDRA